MRLVDDLLDISRVTSGKVRLRPELIDLREAIKVAVEATRPAVEAGQHTLVVQLPEEPLRFHADPTRVAQVVGNLLANAAKYTPQGGRIEVSIGLEENRAVIRVSDNGVWNSRRDASESVRPVYSGREAPGSREGGLGIGLAAGQEARRISRRKRSRGSAGSGKGSTFTIRLPV